MEVEKLNSEVAQQGLDYQYFPGALWSCNASLTFHENQSPGGSSFFQQNLGLTNRWKFQNQKDSFLASDIFYPIGSSTWSTISLDDWASKTGGVTVDFMKLNVQGAELEILRGGETLLSETLGVMAEILFVESYNDRPF